MNLETLKEALGEETHAALVQYVTELTGQRDAARNESIKHRTGLKAKVTELEKINADLSRTQEEMLERLGVESIEALTTLDPKGQAEAAKQYEAKLKRIERDLTERNGAYDELFNRYRGSLQDAALRKALTGHEWIDADLVASFVGARLAWEDDQVLYKTDAGGLVSLEEGLQVLAKDKPHLLKAAGAGGSGYRGKPVNGDSKPSLTRAQFEALPPADRSTFFRTGGQLSE
jgi:hypothetical protein